jgi:hypothetical protein
MMASTSVTFYIRNVLIEGDFTVSLKGRIGRIKIELLPKGGSEKVLGFAVIGQRSRFLTPLKRTRM